MGENMNKLILALFGICVSVSAFGDMMMGPSEIRRLKSDYEQKASKCPEDKPLYSWDVDKCYSCDTTESVEFGLAKGRLQEFCSKICPNRQFVGGSGKTYRYSLNEYCVLKDAPGEDWVLDTEIDWVGWIKKCPEDKPLYVDGECIACDEFNNWDKVSGVPGCEKCPNVVINSEDDKYGNCRFKCPDDRPLLLDKFQKGGACVPCDYNGEHPFNLERNIDDGCERCPNKEKDDKLDVCKEKRG